MREYIAAYVDNHFFISNCLNYIQSTLALSITTNWSISKNKKCLFLVLINDIRISRFTVLFNFYIITIFTMYCVIESIKIYEKIILLLRMLEFSFIKQYTNVITIFFIKFLIQEHETSDNCLSNRDSLKHDSLIIFQVATIAHCRYPRATEHLKICRPRAVSTMRALKTNEIANTNT